MSDQKRPNIIFFMPDQFRADCVGALGNPFIKTPNFDHLAESGCAFRNFFVQQPVCTPSRCSIMTGWYPHVRGHRSLRYLLHEDEPNLLKYLHDAGYWVEWQGKNDLLTKDAMEQSVDHRGDLQTSGQTYLPNPWEEDDRRNRSFYHGCKDAADAFDHDWCAVNNAIEFLHNRPKDRPFFLYLPLTYPHPPYNVEEPYFSMYDPDCMPAPAKADYEKLPRFYRRYHETLWMDKVSEEDQRRIIATYYGMVTRTDALFGQLMEALNEENLAEDTAIFVFADHGDYTCDYGLVEKWWTGLTDDLVHVPLLMNIPGQQVRGEIMDPLTESIDLFPTVMELAGIRDYHTQYGKSLLPLLRGETDTFRDYVFSENGHHPQDAHCRRHPDTDKSNVYYWKQKLQEDPAVMSRAVMVRNKEWKYIKHLDDISELYNLTRDPKEEVNLSQDKAYQPVIQQMENALLKWYMETCDIVPMRADPRDC